MKTQFVTATRRRVFAAALAILALPLTVAAVQAQDWPQRPVRVIVPFAAGGNIDVMGRLMAARLSETLGQQFVVENRVGGGGIVATEAVARSAPDGYTLLWASTNVIAIVPHTTKTPYDPIKDFTPISGFSSSPQVLLVNSKVPAKTVGEFVAWVKAQPQKVAYGGGGGPGSASNLIMQMFLTRAGLDMTNVSYRGTAPALTDLIAGHIPTTFVPLSEASAQAGNPNVRILGVSSGTRSKHMPDVPAIAETFPGYNAVSWTGILGPAGLPKPIVDKIAGEMMRAVKDPKFLEQLAQHGVDTIAEGPEKFAAMINDEIPVWGEAVKASSGKPQ